MLFELGNGIKTRIVHEDNLECVIWAADEGKKNKSMDVNNNVCRDACDNGEVVFKYCPTTEVMSDKLTELLGLNKFPIIKGSLTVIASALRTVGQGCRNLKMGDEATRLSQGIEEATKSATHNHYFWTYFARLRPAGFSKVTNSAYTVNNGLKTVSCIPLLQILRKTHPVRFLL